MNEFMTLNKASAKCGISENRIKILCSSNRIEGASKIGPMWIIPRETEKTSDKRMKFGKYVKTKE